MHTLTEVKELYVSTMKEAIGLVNVTNWCCRGHKEKALEFLEECKKTKNFMLDKFKSKGLSELEFQFELVLLIFPLQKLVGEMKDEEIRCHPEINIGHVGSA